MRRRDIRNARRMASALDWHELEGEPEPDNTDETDGEPDTRIPIGPLDCSRLTDEQLDAPWSLPR